MPLPLDYTLLLSETADIVVSIIIIIVRIRTCLQRRRAMHQHIVGMHAYIGKDIILIASKTFRSSTLTHCLYLLIDPFKNEIASNRLWMKRKGRFL